MSVRLLFPSVSVIHAGGSHKVDLRIQSKEPGSEIMSDIRSEYGIEERSTWIRDPHAAFDGEPNEILNLLLAVWKWSSAIIDPWYLFNKKCIGFMGIELPSKALMHRFAEKFLCANNAWYHLCMTSVETYCFYLQLQVLNVKNSNLLK